MVLKKKETVAESMTEEELEALNNQVEEEKKQISTKKMESVVALVQEEFNLSKIKFLLSCLSIAVTFIPLFIIYTVSFPLPHPKSIALLIL